jgi:glycosyltransferase involved in cell wall biosynthesis
VPTLYVIVPVFNERGTLAECLKRVVGAELPDGWRKSIIVVDDDSEPKCAAAAGKRVEALRAEGVDIMLLRHNVNQGKGAAVRTGFDHAIQSAASDSDLVIIQDADLEYNPNDYASLMAPLLDGSADAVIGTRWGNHREVKGLKRTIHAMGNKILTVLSNAMTGYRLSDMECCYKIFSIALLRTLRPMLTESRFGVEPQIVACLAKLGARVTEVAVWYDPRGLSEGKKIGWRDGVRALYVIMRERFRSINASENAPRDGHAPRTAVSDSSGRG